jgi:hypothetical protein
LPDGFGNAPFAYDPLYANRFGSTGVDNLGCQFFPPACLSQQVTPASETKDAANFAIVLDHFEIARAPMIAQARAMTLEVRQEKKRRVGVSPDTLGRR